jgi:hypothetical protein
MPRRHPPTAETPAGLDPDPWDLMEGASVLPIPPPDLSLLRGLDSRGRPKQKYRDRIATMQDAPLMDEAYRAIMASSAAAANGRDDAHWQVLACFEEACRRKGPFLRLPWIYAADRAGLGF